MADDANGWIVLRGASGNNLRSIDVAIPRGLFTCVTGVSGSGPDRRDFGLRPQKVHAGSSRSPDPRDGVYDHREHPVSPAALCRRPRGPRQSGPTIGELYGPDKPGFGKTRTTWTSPYRHSLGSIPDAVTICRRVPIGSARP
ncbi:MAG: hypothetical protein DCC46_02075 [Armatimonadetes bacterium]|nr:MAG: hypothetical protein DCC46_02075 [Armatimonadota bacterium]